MFCNMGSWILIQLSNFVSVFLLTHLLTNVFLSVDPTGLLVDSALTYVQKCIPQPSVEERRAAYIRASELALCNGVTSVVDFGRVTPMGPPEQPWDDLNGTAVSSDCYHGYPLFCSITFFISFD